MSKRTQRDEGGVLPGADVSPEAITGISTSAVIDTGLWELFTRNDSGWSGADVSFSVPLPDGRLVWLFGDTWLGPINQDRSRPPSAGFVHNSIVVQEPDRLITLHGGTPDEPRALFQPADSSSWYWPGDGVVEGNRLRLLLLRFTRTGEGQWDWFPAGCDLATLLLPDLSIEEIRPVPGPAPVQYGSALLEESDYTYIYGVEDHSDTKYAHLARSRRGDLTGIWEYFTGTDWSTDVSETTPFFSQSVTNEFGVVTIEGGYMLVTMDTSRPLLEWGEIVGYVSERPWGPWHSPRVLYRAPEPDGLRIFAYSTHVHPELSQKGELLISYNVNSLRFADLFADADIYRPRFVRVAVPEFNP